MTHSENENDHFDLDHFDHILAPLLLMQLLCYSYTALMLLLFEMGVIWDLHSPCHRL